MALHLALGTVGRLAAGSGCGFLRAREGGVAEMRSVAWMTAFCAASAATVAVIVDPVARPAVVAGMLGPLVAVAASWLAVERAFQRNPAQVSGLIMSAFLVKAIGF